MHLSDSITLSVRNPQPRPQSPKKSDAKAVANILATRGITVTATPKPKDKCDGQKNPAIPPQLNLNAAVSIIPSAKNSNKVSHSRHVISSPPIDAFAKVRLCDFPGCELRPRTSSSHRRFNRRHFPSLPAYENGKLPAEAPPETRSALQVRPLSSGVPQRDGSEQAPAKLPQNEQRHV